MSEVDGPDDAIEDGMIVPAMPLPLLPLPDIVLHRDLAPATVRVAGVNIKFDGCSHSSGMQRGYAVCRIASHQPCIKYSQVNQHEDWKTCAGWLRAWLDLGCEDDSKEDHLGSEPYPACVRAYMELIE